MTCSKCECLVRIKNKLGYNLYYCGYKKYGVLKALSGLYINNEEYRKNSKTCKYYKRVRKMTNEESDKKCLNCSRMTVSQDVYISGSEEKLNELNDILNKWVDDLRKQAESDQLVLNESKEIIAELENKLNDSNEMCNKQAMRIAEMESQIEKLKCCNNCKNVHYDWREQVREGICNECRKYDKWEKTE